jgi:hypothetical protein
MQVWCFPFSSEGKARRCARALAERGFDDIALLQRGGVWHITAPTDSPLLGESRFFLSGKGLTLAPLKVSLV